MAKVKKKIYEIPEDELRRLVVSKIPRVRPQGEKPKSAGLGIFDALMPKNCEICGVTAGTMTQCGYCGRWVSSINYIMFKKRHANCWNEDYGCCKVCAAFIIEHSERIPCSYCGTLFYRFQERCPHCGAPPKKPS